MASLLRIARVVLGLMFAWLVTAIPAQAQASITGLIKDSSASVLPGVTVEASSPALIEKSRTVVSDTGGQYRIVDLRPGTYTVTFTLAGFSTFKRDGIELTGNFTATVNAEMMVGSVEETITVTGEAPIVDVQGVTRQQVLSAETIDAVPSGRNYSNLGVLIPGISTQCPITCTAGSQDVGGASGDARTNLTVHGSRFRDQRMSINGMTIEGSAGGLAVHGPNLEAMQEVQIDTSGIDMSVRTGGVRLNLVPKDGGNMFAGSLFASGSNQHFQSSNFTDELKQRNLAGTSRVKTLYDVAPTFGGPLKRSTLWFFLSARFMNNVNYVANLFANANAGNPNAWTYVPDYSQQITSDSPIHPLGARFTWQATPRNKIAASFDFKKTCNCPNVATGTISREAAVDFSFFPAENWYLVSWTSPATNRLLLEATAAALPDAWSNRPYSRIDPSLIQVVEQNPAAGYPATYRAGASQTEAHDPFWDVAFIATYVTGAHAFKAGLTDNWGFVRTDVTTPRVITAYQFNRGTPTQFTVNSDPRSTHTRVPAEIGSFIQDKWTIKRVTVSGGLRYDYISKDAPELHLGPAPLLPNRDVTFPDTKVVRHHDLSPRMGVAVDVFGTGRTAVKATLNRYVADESLGGGANPNGSPFSYFQYTAARSWTDGNTNFVPDCDWTNGAAQNQLAAGGDFCGAWTGNSANFGRPIGGTVDDHDVAFGWGHRGYNWEFSTSVQQELVPRRVALDVGFFRRWFGNFTVNDNLAVPASAYDPFSVLVPTDPRLPLSGQTITGFLNINPAYASLPTDNHVRLSSQYGTQSENWQGVDVNVSAKLSGTLIQGGVSTGRTVSDNCAILGQVPEGGVTAQQGVSNGLLLIPGSIAVPFCHQQTPYLTQLKMLGTYTIPHVDVQLSATYQSIPGSQITANLVVSNGDVQQSLGRPLSGNAPNVTVPIIAPGTLYEDRVGQIDLRVGKVIRLRTWRLTTSVDVFNLSNSSAVLESSNSYSSFGTPTRVVGARLVKFSLSASF